MPQKLSYKDFLKSFELAPRLAIELLIENKKGELLLLKRDKEPFVGLWHLPGGFLLKDEPIDDCIQRLANSELDLKIDPIQTERLGLFETLSGDPRGHILHHPVRVKSQNIANKDFLVLFRKILFLTKLNF